ncbi:heme-dependent oxidative N-demethylase family protein [Pelagovum pacificum]|uniref:DUF3445 domain-containing protein n=1 Tax=Pelagovum pacificum TaxID=2588711 RepID=A0A5C5GF67_9RHOB|nr:DUF3445 domain-containing protein [Pelagovum pacificum]QQA44289.1 DUF3445 domain-containing protein [Pelagovum pacificum]TNY32589.1 DUF3445 domain-containing protein [Pelagovum pacificum]
MILQDHMPEELRLAAANRLPKMAPVRGAWVQVDGTYAAQIAERQRLAALHGEAVQRIEPGAEDAVAELFDLVLDTLADDARFGRAGTAIVTPDGRQVEPDRGKPFETLNALLSEDLCLLDKRGEEHVLIAASLCFPAGWTLAQKIGRPLMRIHQPVPPYDDDIGRRVQRFFDGVRPGQPLWRANLHGYSRPDLYLPLREDEPKAKISATPAYWRSERQTVLRLPRTGAVLFAIHTVVVAA